MFTLRKLLYMFQIKRISLITYFVFLILFIFFDVLLFFLKLYFAAILYIILLTFSLLCLLFFSKYIFLVFGTKKVGYICDYTYHSFGRRPARTIPQIDNMIDDRKILSRDYFKKDFSDFVNKNLSNNKKMWVDIYFIRDINIW